MPEAVTTNQKAIIEVLESGLERKRKKNASYSARAFARDLGVSPAFLSQVLKGKKKISLKRAEQIADLLELSDRAKRKLLKAVAVATLATTETSVDNEVEKILFEPYLSPDFVPLNVDQFQFFHHWSHVAILDLANCRGARSDFKWIASRLGITPQMAQDGLERLLRLGLVQKTGGVLKKTNREISIPTTESVNVIRSFHRQMIGKAVEALESEDSRDFQAREISGITMAVDPSKIAEAKKRVALFKREIYELLAGNESKATEVFQFNVQLFPLTKPSGEQK